MGYSRPGTNGRPWPLAVGFITLAALPHALQDGRHLKIAIIGAGAIGGYLGTRLAHAGDEVTFIARGANLDALRTRGIRLINGDGSEIAVRRVNATDDYAAAGPQDVVVLALKAHQVVAVAPQVPKLFGSDTIVVPMQNGIPYWYFHRHPGEYSGAKV